jgi:hypothetical protein
VRFRITHISANNPIPVSIRLNAVGSGVATAVKFTKPLFIIEVLTGRAEW